MKRTADLPISLAPVVAMEDYYPARHFDPPHTHAFCQMAFAVSGVIGVATDDASYVLPPNRAIWIPAGVRHQTSCRGDVRFLALYVDPSLDPQPGVTRVFDVSLLVRSLIDELAISTDKLEFAAREQAMANLLLSEIDRMPRLPATATFPSDRRLRRVCDAILADPSDNRPIDEWAEVAGMGRRSFTRAFREETGMSLVTWRRQIRLMEAASRIAAGQTINAVAYEVGYESSSAFIAMFHRQFGAPPGAYCRR